MITPAIFRSSTIEGLTKSAFAIGSANLLAEFFDDCSSCDGGNLFFTAPFYDLELMESVISQFSENGSRLEIIVKDDQAAAAILQLLRDDQSVTVSVCERLHAKVYIFESARHDFSVLIQPNTSGDQHQFGNRRALKGDAGGR